MNTYLIKNLGGEILGEIEAESRNDDSVQKFADLICEEIRQNAIIRDGIDPGFCADDVTIEEEETEID